MPDFCVMSRSPVHTDSLEIYYNTDSLLTHETELPHYLTRRNILIANASGSLNLLRKLAMLLKDSSTKSKIYLEYTTEIEKNISLVRREIDDISTEMECEIIRSRQLENYLGNLNSKRNSKLTVAAIIVGSATTITPIFVKQTAPQNIVLISGGILSAGLGLLTLNPAGKQIQLVTPNNLLTDIWNGPRKSQVYPPSIWHILNDPAFSNSGLVSKRMLITTKWMKFDLGGEPDTQTRDLLFGNGGLFDQGALGTRASMLTEVMAHINSIKKDLDGFTYSLNDMKIQIVRQLTW